MNGIRLDGINVSAEKKTEDELSTFVVGSEMTIRDSAGRLPGSKRQNSPLGRFQVPEYKTAL